MLDFATKDEITDCIHVLSFYQCPELLLEGAKEWPIHVAIARGRHQILKMYFEKTRKAVKDEGEGRRLCDAKKRSLLSIGVLAGHKKTIECLLKVSLSILGFTFCLTCQKPILNMYIPGSSNLVLSYWALCRFSSLSPNHTFQTGSATQYTWT